MKLVAGVGLVVALSVASVASAQGTQAGFHQYDALLGSGARSEVEAEISGLKKFEAEVGNFDPRGLSPWAAADRELMLSQIQSQRLSLESIRAWEKSVPEAI